MKNVSTDRRVRSNLIIDARFDDVSVLCLNYGSDVVNDYGRGRKRKFDNFILREMLIFTLLILVCFYL